MDNNEKDLELEETVQETEAPEEVKEAPAPKKAPATVTFTVSVWKIVVATAVLVLLLIVLVGAVIYGITGELPYNLGAKETTAAATDPVGTTAPLRTAEDLGMSIEGITDKAVYTVEDAAAAAAAGEVVATAGKYTLTNSQLQVFYWMEFSSFATEAAEAGTDLLAEYNLDITKPLADQLVVGSSVTWEQFFLHNALGTWWRYVGMNIMADEAGFVISDADKASLDAVPAQLEKDAEAEGFANADEMMKERLGGGCTVADFVNYMEMTARGDLYATQFQSTYTPTQEELETFFELNTDYYSYYGISKDMPKPATVRHVLLVPEGATTDSSTGHITATDEQWAAGEAAAQAMLDAWVAAGAKEEDFAALANEHSTDGGSNTNGGIYENVTSGQMVAAFDAWLFDETRKPGDYGIVKTEFGHHLMYYVSQAETDAWLVRATADAMSSGYCLNSKLSAAMEGNAMEPVLSKVVLTDVSQEAVIEETENPTEATTPATE